MYHMDHLVLYIFTCACAEASKSIQSVFLDHFLPGFLRKRITETDALQLARPAAQ